MGGRMSRRGFLRAAGGAVTAIPLGSIAESANEEFRLDEPSAASAGDRILDIHVHFDEKNPNVIRDFVAVAERINLTACLLTPYSHRVQVAEAAKQHPNQIVPFGFIDLDATDVLSQVKDFHQLGYRGLGELEFVKKPMSTHPICRFTSEPTIWLSIAVPYGDCFASKRGSTGERGLSPHASVLSRGDCSTFSEIDRDRRSLR